ncbi:Major facilitator, sugar transporter-like [Trema orientale]|uniref:Major facilitator, sugar transporter-like n=2 Tax=Cannabaceae TaxID=3481 RepID=A0A2P5A3L8_TREOI|nr:Major facilitator, sugar transporter-like [Trema orientale]
MQYSFFVSIYVIGSIIGGIWSGKTADVIGRRGALAVSNLLCITGWFATAFSKVNLSLIISFCLRIYIPVRKP